MQLLVVRHAVAFERSATRWPDDAERPLTPEGAERARKAALGLKRIADPPARVLASPRSRAQETAAIPTRIAGWPEAGGFAQLRRGAFPEEQTALLARTRDRSIAVVGHEPAVGPLLAMCLFFFKQKTAYEMKKMGVALLEFPGAARAGRGRLVWLLPPK